MARTWASSGVLLSVTRRLDGDVRAAHHQRQLARGERGGGVVGDGRAVVIGQRAELPAEVRHVGQVVGHQPAPLAVEHRLVGEDLAGDARDAAPDELLGELVGGGAVAELPDVVERRIPERRIAAAAQVEVSVPDAVALRPGAEQRRVQAGVGPQLDHQRRGRPQLLHRRRRALDVGAQPVELVVGVEVVDQRAALRAGLIHAPCSAPTGGGPRWEDSGGRWPRVVSSAGSWARRRVGARLRLGGRDDGGAGVELRVVVAGVAQGAHQAQRDRRRQEDQHQPCGKPASQAVSSSSTVWGPTTAIDSSSAMPAATSRTSSKVTWSSSSIVISGSASSS